MAATPLFQALDRVTVPCRICERDCRARRTVKVEFTPTVASYFCEKCVRGMSESLGIILVKDTSRIRTPRNRAEEKRKANG